MRSTPIRSSTSPHRQGEPSGTPESSRQATPTANSPARGGVLDNLSRASGSARPTAQRRGISSLWRRSPWSQALLDVRTDGTRQADTVHAESSSTPSHPRVHDTRQRTALAAHAGALPLAEARFQGAGQGLPTPHAAASAETLLSELAGVAAPRVPMGAPTGASSSSSSVPRVTGKALEALLASGDADAVLAVAREAAGQTAKAAEAASTGAIASLIANSGSDGAGPSPLQSLKAAIGEARAHLDYVTEVGINMLDEDDEDDAPKIAEARAMIDQARTALGTIESELVHSFAAQAIDERLLPAEASVLGQLAALRGLHPNVFDLDHGGSDPRVLEGVALSASRTADNARALLGAAGTNDREVLQHMGHGAVNVADMLDGAADSVAKLRSACPQGTTQDALGALARAIEDMQAWLAGHDVPGAGRTPAVPPQSPLRTPAPRTVAPMNATISARLSEMAFQRSALGELPKLARRVSRDMPGDARNREISNRLVHLMSRAMGEHTPLDERIELARIAMYFGPNNAAESGRLARMLTSVALRVDAPTTGEVNETIGLDDSSEIGRSALSQQAIFNRLGDIMGSLNPEEGRRFANSIHALHDARDGGTARSSLRLTATAIAERRLAPHSAADDLLQLPVGTEWLGDSAQRKNWAARYFEQSSVRHPTSPNNIAATYVDNRSVIRQLVALASDMEALRGHRHHFVQLAKELFKRDDERIADRYRPAISSGQRFELLRAMVVQLPQFGHASGDKQTISDVLSFVLKQIEGFNLSHEHKLRLVKELLAVTEHLPTSRFSASDAAQSHALDAAKAVLYQLRNASSAVPLLRQVLASSETWSTQRSAYNDLPRTRGEKRTAVATSILPPVGLVQAAKFAAGAIKGRASPRHEAADLVLDALQQQLAGTVGLGHSAPTSLIPLYGDLLRQCIAPSTESAPNLGEGRLQRTLSYIVRGGLPVGGDAATRDRYVAQVLGDDPAVRAAVAKALTRAIADKSGPASSPFGRLASARYLQNLLSAGAGELSEADRSAAIAGVNRTLLSQSLTGNAGRESMTLTALFREAQRDGFPLTEEVVRHNMHLEASQSIKWLRRVPGAVRNLRDAATPEDKREAAKPIHEAAERMKRVAAAYPMFDSQQRGALRTAFMSAAPTDPAQYGSLAATGQLPALALITSLAQFSGQRPRDARELLDLAGQARSRLNPTNQEAAINQMFDAYDEATSAGRDLVLSFVTGLNQPHESGAFASAAVKLISSTVADETMRAKLGAEESERIVATVLERMKTLPADNASDLVSNVINESAELPRALIDGFIAVAPRLEPRAIAQLLTAELKRASTLPPGETATMAAHWQALSYRAPSGSPQRETLALFAAIADRMHEHHSGEATRGHAAPVPEAAASQLASALHSFEPRLQAAVLSHIAGEHAPQAVRESVLNDMFGSFARLNPQQRQLAIERGGRTGIGRGLMALAAQFGAPQLRGGQVVRPGLDEPFLDDSHSSQAAPGSLKTLGEALTARERKPQEITVTLEAIAERFTAMPQHFQQQFEDLFKRFVADGRLRSPQLQDRVIETLRAGGGHESAVGNRLLQAYGSDLDRRVVRDAEQALAKAQAQAKAQTEAQARLPSMRAGRIKLLEHMR